MCVLAVAGHAVLACAAGDGQHFVLGIMLVLCHYFFKSVKKVSKCWLASRNCVRSRAMVVLFVFVGQQSSQLKGGGRNVKRSNRTQMDQKLPRVRACESLDGDDLCFMHDCFPSTQNQINQLILTRSNVCLDEELRFDNDINANP